MKCLILSILLLHAACMCASSMESLLDSWRIVYYERNDALPSVMTWSFYCDIEMIEEAVCHQVYPTAYNLLDNIDACYVYINEINAYIDTHDQLVEIAGIIHDLNRVLLMHSKELNKDYMIAPVQLKYTQSVIEGILYVVVNHYVSPSKNCSM